MTFAEVLPHLAAGRVATRPDFFCFQYRWKNAVGLEYMDPVDGKWDKSVAGVSELLASDWTLVEEPTREPDVCSETCGKWREEARAAIARLTRELAATKQAKAENDERFMAERDQARRELAEANRALPAARICQGSTWPRPMFCVYDSAGKCVCCGMPRGAAE